MVYDVTSEVSFDHINDWFVEVNRYAAENTCKILVGNKIDKADKIVPTEKAQVGYTCIYADGIQSIILYSVAGVCKQVRNSLHRNVSD